MSDTVGAGSVSRVVRLLHSPKLVCIIFYPTSFTALPGMERHRPRASSRCGMISRMPLEQEKT